MVAVVLMQAWAVPSLMASMGVSGTILGLSAAKIAAGIVVGAISGAITGGAKGALSGAIGGGVFAGIGSYFGDVGFMSGDHLLKTAAHGVTGGALAEAFGGDFSDGFIGAGAAQLAAPGIDGIYEGSGEWYAVTARVTTAAVVGGTTAEVTGGKFANGAYTAAFARLANDENKKKKKEVATVVTTEQLSYSNADIEAIGKRAINSVMPSPIDLLNDSPGDLISIFKSIKSKIGMIDDAIFYTDEFTGATKQQSTLLLHSQASWPDGSALYVDEMQYLQQNYQIKDTITYTSQADWYGAPLSIISFGAYKGKPVALPLRQSGVDPATLTLRGAIHRRVSTIILWEEK